MSNVLRRSERRCWEVRRHDLAILLLCNEIMDEQTIASSSITNDKTKNVHLLPTCYCLAGRSLKRLTRLF